MDNGCIEKGERPFCRGFLCFAATAESFHRAQRQIKNQRRRFINPSIENGKCFQPFLLCCADYPVMKPVSETNDNNCSGDLSDPPDL